MKKTLMIPMISLIMFPMIAAGQSEYEKPEYEKTEYTSEYYLAQKAEVQRKSTEMRKSYYEKYKAKGYDVSLITPDLLDGTKTEESKFWDTLKVVVNNAEMPGRKEYVTKLQSKGLDVSGFTETVMYDSGKFWELVKKLESSYTSSSTYTEDKKPVSTPSTQNLGASFERVKKLFIERIEKLPSDKKAATLERLQKNIETQLSKARSAGNKVLVAKLEIFLQIVKEKLGNSTDDDALLNSLFSE